jgi:hypothetical protein
MQMKEFSITCYMCDTHTWQRRSVFIRDKPILPSERMLHKDYDRVCIRGRRLPCTEDCCQSKEAAISHLGSASVTTVNHPVEQWANIWITFKQKNDRLSSQLIDLQQNIETVWMKTQWRCVFLIPCYRTLIEKLTVIQLVKKMLRSLPYVQEGIAGSCAKPDQLVHNLTLYYLDV